MEPDEGEAEDSGARAADPRIALAPGAVALVRPEVFVPAVGAVEGDSALTHRRSLSVAWLR